MSIDSSLKSAGNLDGIRTVMTRAERVAALKADKKTPERGEAIGLPKTKVRE